MREKEKIEREREREEAVCCNYQPRIFSFCSFSMEICYIHTEERTAAEGNRQNANEQREEAEKTEKYFVARVSSIYSLSYRQRNFNSNNTTRSTQFRQQRPMGLFNGVPRPSVLYCSEFNGYCLVLFTTFCHYLFYMFIDFVLFCCCCRCCCYTAHVHIQAHV